MSYIDVLNDAAARADAASTKAEAASQLLEDIVNGPSDTFVTTLNGQVPTAATAIDDLRDQITAGGTAPITESVTLGTNGQQNVSFNNIQTSGLAVYVDSATSEGSYRYFNYVVDGSSSIFLNDSFDAGTVIHGVSQEIGGDVQTAVQQTQANAQLAEDWAILTGSTVDGSEFSSKHYAQESSASASAAADSESNAATSETNASNSSSLAEDWATLLGNTVDGVEYSSKYYAQQSGSFADTSAQAADISASAASDSSTSANESEASAAAALVSENNAATSETNAASSATAAATSETNASNSASAAATSESNAASSATDSANSASASASSATDSADSAVTSEEWATLIGNTVDGVEYSAKYYAQQSGSFADTAAQTADIAASAASDASTSANDAASSASASATSASNAASSATAAADSATDTANIYDQFDDRYLGAKASAPSTDNDSNPLLTGALYWSTSLDAMQVWNGAEWVNPTQESAQFTNMPTVNGDPIVESGTNSDGYWVKYADGTQMVKGSQGIDLTITTYQTWDMPLAFFDIPAASVSLYNFSPDTAVLDAFQGITLITDESRWRTVVRDGTAAGETSVPTMLFAFGRWK